MKRLMMFAAAVLAASPAMAQTWTYLGSAEGEWDAYYDGTRLTRAGSTVRFWIKRQLVREQSGVSYFLSQAEIDCAAQTARVLFTAAYGADGTVGERDTNPVPAEPIPPGTFYDEIRQQIC